MVPFRCVPMDTAAAHRFRETGVDDGGNRLHRKLADHPAPCRQCLTDAVQGEAVLLGSYHFGRPKGIYWTPSPIFVHEQCCAGFSPTNLIPEIVRNRLVSVRAYGSDDFCLYDLGDVSEGRNVDPLIDRALADHRTDYVNIHTARPGCFLCRVVRM
jgi:hypothetical protein